jgi:hypothetical protein
VPEDTPIKLTYAALGRWGEGGSGG